MGKKLDLHEMEQDFSLVNQPIQMKEVKDFLRNSSDDISEVDDEAEME